MLCIKTVVEPVADVGCGPGHVTAHLRAAGVDALGIDLSPAMIEVATGSRLKTEGYGGHPMHLYVHRRRT